MNDSLDTIELVMALEGEATLEDLSGRELATLKRITCPPRNIRWVPPDSTGAWPETVLLMGCEGIDSISLEIADNLAVGARDPLALADIVKDLKIKGADAIVLSACVQMPSLAAIPIVQARFPIPVLSAAVATTWRMLKVLGLEPIVPDAGALLSGNYA